MIDTDFFSAVLDETQARLDSDARIETHRQAVLFGSRPMQQAQPSAVEDLIDFKTIILDSFSSEKVATEMVAQARQRLQRYNQQEAERAMLRSFEEADRERLMNKRRFYSSPYMEDPRDPFTEELAKGARFASSWIVQTKPRQPSPDPSTRAFKHNPSYPFFLKP